MVGGMQLQVNESLGVGGLLRGHQRQVYGYGISAKRYAFYTWHGSKLEIIKASEHGLGLYYRPKEGRDSSCDVPVWIKEGWQWILHRALGLPCENPDWFRVPVMRRIAISTPSVMATLRRLNRDQARPYNFALSPVLANLSDSTVTLLGRFEKDPSRWEEMTYVNIHDGNTHTLKPPTLPVLAQNFDEFPRSVRTQAGKRTCGAIRVGGEVLHAIPAFRHGISGGAVFRSHPLRLVPTNLHRTRGGQV
jgi:hypothetical protein